ncbi:STAS domain-containing protein [Microbispora sp. RL4-1S]|uniref:Anti-sigma factor antagonist n=1 Tax=Microbispora oryzae TaxID=2806554 RepID=A0A940WVF6_9ACTN|nr:STAS domain-containing protein [Microbispora oryzae]MBP2708120.1 STAS domain-containing protein [Microbispora oryzae]
MDQERAESSAPSLSLSVHLRGDVVVVAMSGQLDMMSAASLRACLADAIRRSSPPRVVVDAEELTFCDSTGVSVLMGALPAIGAAGGRMALSGVRGRLGRILRITGLAAELAVHPTVDDAAAYLTRLPL